MLCLCLLGDFIAYSCRLKTCLITFVHYSQARDQGPGPPPPIKIEKQKKKKKKKGHQRKFKVFHLYFATFLVENIIFSAVF